LAVPIFHPAFSSFLRFAVFIFIDLFTHRISLASVGTD
jgi:hypothetical protein